MLTRPQRLPVLIQSPWVLLTWHSNPARGQSVAWYWVWK